MCNEEKISVSAYLSREFNAPARKRRNESPSWAWRAFFYFFSHERDTRGLLTLWRA